MGNLNFLLNYIQSCVGGRLQAADCGAVWQLGIILALVVLMVLTLVVLRLRARGQASAA